MQLRLYGLYSSYLTTIFKDNIIVRLALDGAPMSLQAIADMRNLPHSFSRERQCINKALLELSNNKQVVNSLKQFMT